MQKLVQFESFVVYAGAMPLTADHRLKSELQPDS
jgi:hypothetical protein